MVRERKNLHLKLLWQKFQYANSTRIVFIIESTASLIGHVSDTLGLQKKKMLEYILYFVVKL